MWNSHPRKPEKDLRFSSQVLLYHSAEGGSRTHTRSKPRWILNPVRLPFRHFGRGFSTIGVAGRTSSQPSHRADQIGHCANRSPEQLEKINTPALGRAPVTVLSTPCGRKRDAAAIRQSVWAVGCQTRVLAKRGYGKRPIPRSPKHHSIHQPSSLWPASTLRSSGARSSPSCCNSQQQWRA